MRPLIIRCRLTLILLTTVPWTCSCEPTGRLCNLLVITYRTRRVLIRRLSRIVTLMWRKCRRTRLSCAWMTWTLGIRLWKSVGRWVILLVRTRSVLNIPCRLVTTARLLSNRILLSVRLVVILCRFCVQMYGNVSRRTRNGRLRIRRANFY